MVLRDRYTNVHEYQNLVTSGLKMIYPSVTVVTEWNSMREESGLYNPRLDIAVGPFATREPCAERYDDLMEISRKFVLSLLDIHLRNIREFDNPSYQLSYFDLKQKNYNARCLLAIEIENRVSRKHLMGGAVNASALGRIGMLVAWTPEKLKAAIKLKRYLEFLGSVGKNTFNTTNLLILDRNQLLWAVQSSSVGF